MRRPKVDPLAPIDAPTWFVIQDVCGQYKSVRQLEPMENLRAIVLLAAANRAAMGWEVEEMSPFCSAFFCSKDGVREQVGIVRLDPNTSHITPSRALPDWPDNVVPLRRHND